MQDHLFHRKDFFFLISLSSCNFGELFDREQQTLPHIHGANVSMWDDESWEQEDVGERRGDEKKERAQGGGRAARKSETEETSQRHLCIRANWMDAWMRDWKLDEWN